MPTRAMYIWKLRNVIEAEGSVAKIVEKARRAQLSQLWVKLADGATKSDNVQGTIAARFTELIERCAAARIEVWGWHVPHCADQTRTAAELALIGQLVQGLALNGLIMDAEGGDAYFKGDSEQAERYGAGMKTIAAAKGVPLAISSNDIPQNLAGWLPRFDTIAAHADINYPQVYYGGSPSVVNRLDRAARANAHLTIPFAPVGAAWIGDGGGCQSGSACAERAAAFIALAKERNYPLYSFWHWGGAPLEFWRVLNTTPA